MKAATRALIQAAKARADHQQRKAMAQAPAAVCVSPALVDEMMQQERWWTFSELEEKFHVSYDSISRAFKGRDGVAKFGSDYRVSDATVRTWLSEALAKGKAAA